MPVRFGVNFPAWFDPNYPPSKPICPVKPNQIIIHTTNKHIKEIYINGLSPNSLAEILSEFSDREKYFLEIAEESQYVSIYEIVKTEILQPDGEYEKTLKEWTKKTKEYEKFLNEYEMRIRKYPELLEKYKECKFVYEKQILEDELIEKEISKSMLESEIVKIKRRLEEFKSCI